MAGEPSRHPLQCCSRHAEAAPAWTARSDEQSLMWPPLYRIRFPLAHRLPHGCPGLLPSLSRGGMPTARCSRPSVCCRSDTAAFPLRLSKPLMLQSYVFLMEPEKTMKSNYCRQINAMLTEGDTTRSSTAERSSPPLRDSLQAAQDWPSGCLRASFSLTSSMPCSPRSFSESLVTCSCTVGSSPISCRRWTD